MKRKIIHIDEAKCNGCGLCIPNCPEGAIRIIDGKARLVSDLCCDGLGACLGHCPQGAITIEAREAEPYDEERVMANIVKQGRNTIRAHLEHLREHGETAYLDQALAYLQAVGIKAPAEPDPAPEPAPDAQPAHSGCPGARAMAFRRPAAPAADVDGGTGTRASALTHWPIQLHLLAPDAAHYRGADLLLAADCTAFALGDFHRDCLKDKALAIACPKLDTGQDVYLEKLRALIETARINTLTVIVMQVPCCRGLLGLAQKAVAQAERKVPVKCVIVGLQGDIVSEEWV